MFKSHLALELDGAQVQKWENVLEPELTVDLGDFGRVVGLGRLRFDPINRVEPDQPSLSNDFRSQASRRGFIGDKIDLELRELYLDTYVGDAFLRLGKQQVVWGQADGLRVLDQVNPLDYREFILPAFEDSRIPLWMVNVEFPVGPFTAQFLWIPDHTYDDVPEPGAAFSPTSPLLVPAGAPGVTVEGDVHRPTKFVEDDDFGFRLTTFAGGWDLSLNYLYHYYDQAIPVAVVLPGGSVRVDARYERSHLIGGSFSNVFGSFTLRGEVAYSTGRHFLRDSGDGVYESDELGYVLGLDYQHDSDLRVSGQFFQSAVMHRRARSYRDTVESVLTLFAAHEFDNDTYVVSMMAQQGLNRGDGLIQLELEHRLYSNVVLGLGIDVFYGGTDGIFGQFGDESRVTVGATVGF